MAMIEKLLLSIMWLFGIGVDNETEAE